MRAGGLLYRIRKHQTAVNSASEVYTERGQEPSARVQERGAWPHGVLAVEYQVPPLTYPASSPSLYLIRIVGSPKRIQVRRTSMSAFPIFAFRIASPSVKG